MGSGSIDTDGGGRTFFVSPPRFSLWFALLIVNITAFDLTVPEGV